MRKNHFKVWRYNFFSNTVKNKSNSNFIKIFLMVFTIVVFCTSVNATLISVFSNPANGWTQFAEEDLVGSGGFYVGPGWGGQKFDAEYLLYQLNGNTLSIGLQTGFNLKRGRQWIGGVKYFAGDLALSFDGDITGIGGSGYEYAVDFGLKTKDWGGHKVGNNPLSGIDDAGLYSGITWNNDILFSESAPFAMDSGTLIADALQENNWGKEGSGANKSYYRIVSFDISGISEITPGEDFTVNAHWTMSCGNDAIDGSFTATAVPEPTTVALLGIGLVGLAGAALRRKLKMMKQQ